jgi:hypothetical protein
MSSSTTLRRTWLRRYRIPAAALVVAAVAAGCVSGPVPNAPPQDPNLVNRGYQEREYFFDSIATAYAPVGTLDRAGRWAVEETTRAKFRTRLIVRRPVDPAKFNGTVFVEWNNVSSGSDISPTYVASNAELVRDGYVFVGVTAQKIGVDSLRSGEPARWDSLVHPGDDYSYDIFTQAGRAVRNRLGVDPLDGLVPETVIAAGESQSASRLVTYVNAINPIEHAFDAYLLYSRGSGASSIQSGVTMPESPLIRTDQPEPVIDVQTEGDIVVLRSHLARQPDARRFRLWEVAGGAHADEYTLSGSYPPRETVAGSPCEYRFNSAPTFAVVSAAVQALDRWVEEGIAPRRAPRIRLGPDPAAEDPVLRDQDGHALGGIRVPELEAPVATINGLANPAATGAPPLFQRFCRLFGRTIPFTQAQIDARWPTKAAFVRAYHRATDRLVARGFVLHEDAAALKSHAASRDIGRP